MKIQRLKTGDASKMMKLSALFKDVFELDHTEPASENHLERLLKNENSIYLVAEENGEIVGGLSAFLCLLFMGIPRCLFTIWRWLITCKDAESEHAYWENSKRFHKK